MKEYEKILAQLKEKFFMDPNGKNIETLVNMVRFAVETLISHQGNGPLYPSEQKRSLVSQINLEAEIPKEYSKNQNDVLASLPKHMQGSVKANNPFMVKNIIPIPAFMHLVTNLAVSLYMPNAVTGEDAAETLNAEMSCASAIAKLAGLDPEKAAGVFTFGGTGTNLYASKIGLTKIDSNYGLEGLKGEGVVIVGSRASHYSHQTVSNWLGIGQNNYIRE